MTYFDALLLGIIQGLTEFLPVSSTGHLVIARDMFGLQINYGLAVDATFHFATAFAVLFYFRKDFKKILLSAWAFIRKEHIETETKILLLALIVGTIPGVLFGLALESKIDSVFRTSTLVAWMLIAGSGLFLLAEYIYKKIKEYQTLTIHKGFVIGLFQALALIPGISRSGATISSGMLLGLSREASARFAFLLSTPIILGGGAKKLLDLSEVVIVKNEWLIIGFGALIAFGSGLACIHYLLKFLKNHTLIPFVVYRIILAVLVLLFLK